MMDEILIMSFSDISADNGKHNMRLEISSELVHLIPDKVGKLFKDG
jgi:hypothetical protein